MSLQDIKNQIISEAKSEAKKIVDEAKSEAKKYESEKSASIDKKTKKLLEEAKNEVKNEARSTLITANIDAKNEILDKKRQIISQVKDEIVKGLLDLDDATYKKIIKKELTKAKDLNLEDISIIPSETKLELTKETAKEIIDNPKIEDAKKEITGGFMLRSGETLIDFSIKNIVEENRGAIETLISKEIDKYE